MFSGQMFASRGMIMLRKSIRQSMRFPQVRSMGGGGAASGKLEEPKAYAAVGEFLGFVMWMWVFHRARHDLPVVLGWRHPWDHAPDPYATHDLPADSYAFEAQTSKDLFDPFGEADDDEEEEEEDEDED